MATLHLMSAEDAAASLAALQAAGVEFSLGGGWAVDALLGEETRLHSDLDLWVPASQVHELLVTMVEVGVDKVFPWPGDRPWNWVLHDGASRRVDLHFYEGMDAARWRYGSALDGELFPFDALNGSGTVGGLPVRCESPEWAVRFRTEYEPRDVDRHDVRMLCERFDLKLPEAYR